MKRVHRAIGIRARTMGVVNCEIIFNSLYLR